MESLIDFLLNFYGPLPYFLIFCILLACGFGLPIPEDIILIVAGILSYYGVTNVWIMVVVCTLGVLIGDSAVFYLGHRFGPKVIQNRFLKKWLHPERVDSLKGNFQKRGNKIIFIARFMPGLRAPMFFTAGSMHVKYSVFLAYDGLAAVLSVPAIIVSIYLLGDHLEGAIRRIKHAEIGIVIAIACLVTFWLVKKRLKAKRESF